MNIPELNRILKAQNDFALKSDGSIWSVPTDIATQSVKNLMREKTLPAVITDISAQAKHNMLIAEDGGL